MGIKTIRSANTAAMAGRLYEISKARKVLEKEEKELRDHFKKSMETSDSSILKVADYIFTLDVKAMTTISRDLLTEKLGFEEVKQFEKITVYKVLDLKKVA